MRRFFAMSVSAYKLLCMPVSLLAYLKNYTSELDLIFDRMLPVAVARSYSDDNAIRYVLPVLWP